MTPEDERTRSAVGSDHAALRSVYLLILAVFAGISVAAIMTSRPLRSANDRSRWCTVWSLAERGTYRIDEIDTVSGWSSIDKVRHDDHFYSSKPPLLPTVVAGLYSVVRRVTGWRLPSDVLVVSRTILLLINFLPLLVWLALLVRIVQRHAKNSATGILTVSIAAFATLLTPFQTTFNNHSAGAVSLGICLFAMSRILSDDRRKARYFALAGFFAALTCTCELPAALFGIASFVLLAWKDAGRTFKAYVPAALIPLGAFFVTNYLATGGWKPFYMSYGTEKYRFVIDGIPSYWMRPQGLDQNAEPTWLYALHCLIGHHGIFSLTPIFALSVIGCGISAVKPSVRLLPLILTGMVLSAAIFGFYLTRTQNYNYGGNSAGLRWMFWLVPFWILALIPALDALWPRFRIPTALLIAVSVYSSTSALDNPWQHPWLYHVMSNAGWIDYSVPPPKLDRQHQTWLTSLPTEFPVTVAFESIGPSGASKQFELSALREADGVVECRLDGAASSDRSEILFGIRRTPFEAGEQPREFVSAENEDDRAQVVAFLQCTPFGGSLRARVTGYLKTRIRNDAFSYVKSSCRTLQKGHGDGPDPGDIYHRFYVWHTDAVPFGVLQIEKIGTFRKTGAVVFREIWRLVALRSPVEN